MKFKNSIIQIVMIVAMILGSFNFSFAQDSSKVSQDSSKASLDFGIDMVSRYIWRGTQLGGTSPNVQPFVELEIGKFVLGAWGSYSLGGENSFQEYDFYASYSLLDDKVSITVTDYFFPDELSDYDYFNYNEKTTGHVIEASASFNGTEKIPFSVMIAVNIFGADAKRISDDLATLNSEDGIQYSTYLELGFVTTLKSVDLEAFLGFNLTDPRASDLSGSGYVGESGYYGNDIGIVNLGITLSKEIEITDKFGLPVTVSVITNPQAQKIFMVFGFSL